MNKTEIGNLGESIVCDYLIDRGLHIMERNYRCKLGEVDIIAAEGDTICFVEVKLRKSQAYGRPFEAVNRSKQNKIIRTALQYIVNNRKSDYMCRFDIAEVNNINGKYEVNYIENAFEYSGKYGY